MIRGLRSSLIAGLLVASAFLLAGLALDHYLVAQGLRDLQRIDRGESRLSFDFDQARDLIGGDVNGAQDSTWADGIYSATLPSGQANVRLNLRGLALNAGRYTQFHARVRSSTAARLHLIFDQPGRLDQLTATLDLAPGWNSLKLSLDQLDFRPHAGGAPQPWGGSSGLVGEFRLYFSGPAGLQIALDQVLFRRPGHSGEPAGIQWLGTADAAARLRSDAPVSGQGRPVIGVLLDLVSTRPEQNLALRDQLRQIDAETLFWPAWRGRPEAPPESRLPPLGWSPGWGLVLAYTLLALWWRWRRQASVRAPALIDLIIGLTPILALNLGLGLGEEAPPDSRAWLTAALLFQLSGLHLRGSSFLGARAAWKAAIPMLLFAAATLLLVAALTAHWQKPGLQRIVGYLPFVLLQQALLLGFIWPRLVALAPSQAPVVAACLFGLAHAPNFSLMCLTLLGAWWWTRHFRQHHSWLPILLTHYLLGLLLISCLPPDWLYSAETGLRYFQVQ
ncbi:MAG: hypothetical protein R3F18_02660 [Lysobacterales bacterium]|nr:hypothetical protein [Rhodanobacteraceae bacterium]